jgi:hypothetical protein
LGSALLTKKEKPAETLAEIEGMLVLEEVMPAKPTPIRNSLVDALNCVPGKSLDPAFTPSVKGVSKTGLAPSSS